MRWLNKQKVVQNIFTYDNIEIPYKFTYKEESNNRL